MTDFNFLRIKWPKLAAIAADASRLVEVSPSSAISTMQNFCEWAADIALDLNDIKTQSGITQQEKIETLKAIGHAPTDIIGRFQNVMLAGGRRLYRQNEDVEEARMCIEDVYEIGRWLNKEADRAGWPPKSDYYRPMVSPLGMQGEGGGYSSGGVGEKLRNYQPLIIMGVGALVVIAIAVALIVYVTGGFTPTDAKQTTPNITPTPTVSTTPQLVTEPAGETSTPAPEASKFLNDQSLRKFIDTSQNTCYYGKWTYNDKAFTIGDKHYENGIGMFILKSRITQKQGTMTLTCNLDDDYDKLMFDLGNDANLQYGAGYGKFRIQVYCDSDRNDPAYDSGLNEYDFTDMGVVVNISGCKKLIIKLTEQKGTKGTINVVLGDIRLVKSGAASPAGTDSASASPSPSPSPTPTSSGASGGGGNAGAVPPKEPVRGS